MAKIDRGKVARAAAHSEARDGRQQRSAAPAIDRAIRLLGLLQSAPQQSLPLSEIARRLQIPKSTALNICSALLQGQMLRKSQDGYQLGRRTVELGSAYVSSIDIVREFYEASRFIGSDLRAMIQLAVLDEEINAVYLARQDCHSGLRLGLRAEIGRHVPANCTAAGKALLAALPENILEARLSGLHTLPALTKNSIASPAKLQKELETIRRRGYSSENEEVLPGVACIAKATKTSHREDGLLAVSITALTNTLSPKRQKLIRTTLDKLMAQLEERL